MPSFGQRIRDLFTLKPYYMRRDVITHSEGQLPVIRIIGFWTMIIAAVAMSIAVYIDSPSGISVSFFIIMLGFSFSFPEMLEGHEGLSTMRIIVFMVTNVICMLLLKIGWDKSSLTEIGLNEWWMGVIAFVFGAKAAQTYFESKLAVRKSATEGTDELRDADYVNLAIGQNQSMLYAKGNVRLIAPGKKKVNNTLIDCVTIHLKDNNTAIIPAQLPAIPANGPKRNVETEIVPNVDKPTVSLDAGDSIAVNSLPDFLGSIGTIVKLSSGEIALLTCSHVMTKGSSFNHNGLLSPNLQSKLAGTVNGDWFYAVRDSEFDIALIKNFNATSLGLPNNMAMSKQSRDMLPADAKKTKVTIVGRKDFYSQLPNKNAVEAFVVIHQALNGISLGYTDGSFEMVNLMLLSKSIEPEYQAPTRPGDSGSLVIDSAGIPIGLVVAQNSKFTYAISLNKILKKLVATLI